MIINKLPKDVGYYMPAEFSEHFGTIFIWPERPGSWPHGAKPAEETFTKMILEVSKFEKVFLVASAKKYDYVKSKFENENVKVLQIETNDSWARDTAPTFVINNDGDICGINWQFNAWGGEYDGLYADFTDDDKLAMTITEKLHCNCFDASPFVLEGGSIHTDGEGTLIVTESCLLSKGRNPNLSKDQIEQTLKNYLGIEKIIWLPRGIYNDETNEHIDNICAFISPGEVVLAWTDNENDPQYPLSKACLDTLEQETDAKGRKIKVHKLPIPDVPVCISEYDMEGFIFEEGEDVREVGERLAASYVNFYFANGIILLPQFGGKNRESDLRAVKILSEVCPNRKIIPIPAHSLIVGGGNIHCVTQQIPNNKIMR